VSAARRYRRRPSESDLVDAVHFADGSFPLEFLQDDEQVRSAGAGSGAIVIETRNGTRKATVDVGDWILRHHDGGVSACKPDVFESTYEQVGD
jgi:hypothetical protein